MNGKVESYASQHGAVSRLVTIPAVATLQLEIEGFFGPCPDQLDPPGRPPDTWHGQGGRGQQRDRPAPPWVGRNLWHPPAGASAGVRWRWCPEALATRCGAVRRSSAVGQRCPPQSRPPRRRPPLRRRCPRPHADTSAPDHPAASGDRACRHRRAALQAHASRRPRDGRCARAERRRWVGARGRS